MSLYEINLVKTLTIEALVNGSFPPIKATDDQALPFVGPRTVAYIHALIVDTVTVLQTESTNAKALQNEAMLRQELEKMKPAVMCKQLQHVPPYTLIYRILLYTVIYRHIPSYTSKKSIY